MIGRRLSAAAALGVVAADQLLKATAAQLGRNRLLHPVDNPGLSVGVADLGSMLEVTVGVLGVVAVLGWAHHGSRRGRAVPAFGLAMFVAGSLSNLADRLLFGAVRDQIVVGSLVINAADVAVVIGILVLARSAMRIPQRLHNPGCSERATPGIRQDHQTWLRSKRAQPPVSRRGAGIPVPDAVKARSR